MSLSICDDKKSIVEETAGFKIFLRDISQPMVDAWRDTQAFGCESFTDSIQVCYATHRIVLIHACMHATDISR